MANHILIRNDTAANWAADNPVLEDGEMGVQDGATPLMKIGDGVTPWLSLPFASSSSIASVFGRTGAISAQTGDYAVSQVTGAAPLASPALTGSPTAPTVSALDDSTKLATTAYADSAVGVEAVRATAAENLRVKDRGAWQPTTAYAVNDQVTNANIVYLCTTAHTSGASFAGTDWSQRGAQSGAFAPLASPAFTGTPTAPTPATADSTTKVATTAFAQAAIAAAVTGSGNVKLTPSGATVAGSSAGTPNTDGSLTAFGASAAAANTSGTQNTAIGNTALSTNDSGYQNTAIGFASLQAATGTGNTAVGAATLQATTTGAGNVAVGNSAAAGNTTGGYNVAIGQQSLRHNTTGGANVAIGFNALQSSVSGASNVAIGNGAMQSGDNSGGGYNVAIGPAALANLGNVTGNVAIGSGSQQNVTTGGRNVAVGQGTLTTCTTGGVNTAIGDNVLNLLTTGQYDTAVGVDSMKLVTTAIYSTAVGVDALADLTTGNYNTAIGEGAGGADNISSGGQPGSGYGTVAGAWNTFVGKNASVDNSDPSFVTALGAQTICKAAGTVAIGIDHTGLAAQAAVQDLFVLGTTNHQVRLPGLPSKAFVAADKYVVCDSNGNLHLSSLGPAS